MTLKYLRQYVTQKEPAYEFEVGEATVHDTIEWVGNTLVKDEEFKLPGKKALLEDGSGYRGGAAMDDYTEKPDRHKELFGQKPMNNYISALFGRHGIPIEKRRSVCAEKIGK